VRIRFLAPARDELESAVHYYNSERPGLGKELRSEVRSALKLILSHPNAWQAFGKDTRRCVVNRFPYGIVYQLRQDEILVVAVMHLHRDPEYWHERL